MNADSQQPSIISIDSPTSDLAVTLAMTPLPAVLISVHSDLHSVSVPPPLVVLPLVRRAICFDLLPLPVRLQSLQRSVRAGARALRREIGANEAGQRDRDHVQAPLATVLAAVGKLHDALAVPHATFVVALVDVAIRIRDLCMPVCGRRPGALLRTRRGAETEVAREGQTGLRTEQATRAAQDLARGLVSLAADDADLAAISVREV